jgi:hypothetical protein
LASSRQCEHFGFTKVLKASGLKIERDEDGSSAQTTQTVSMGTSQSKRRIICLQLGGER